MDRRKGICDLSRNGLQSQHFSQHLKMVSIHDNTDICLECLYVLPFCIRFDDSALYQFLEKKNTKMKSTVLSVGRDGSALFSFKFITVDDFDGTVTIILITYIAKHFLTLLITDG